MLTIAHIVAPFAAAPESDLFVAQPITFESMRRARAFSGGRVQVELLSAQFPEDAAAVPADFRRTPDLERCAEARDPGSSRRLPLLEDVLDRAYRSSDATCLVYSNVDIGVMPQFYEAVADSMRQHEALVVNRRTIAAHFRRPDQLPTMYGQIGASHPGYDCFAFLRTLVPTLRLGAVCLGAPGVGAALFGSLLVRAGGFLAIEDQHLTFHVGDERAWAAPEQASLAAANLTECRRVLSGLLEGCSDPSKTGWLERRVQIVDEELSRLSPETRSPGWQARLGRLFRAVTLRR